jgi:hypothetical protein
MNEEELKAWWDAVKSSDSWTGAIVGLSWDELWPEARTSLEALADAAIAIRMRSNV